MARQQIVVGLPGPVYVNETRTQDEVLAGVYLNESSSGPISGTLVVTEADDGVSGAGALAIAGAAAITEADDTLSSAAALAIAGSASNTETDDTLSAASVLAIAGALAATETDDALAATAALAITGADATGEADDTLSATGALAITGAASLTEAGDSLAASGTLAITGTAAVEDDDTLSATGEGATVQKKASGTGSPFPFHWPEYRPEPLKPIVLSPISVASTAEVGTPSLRSSLALVLASIARRGSAGRPTMARVIRHLSAEPEPPEYGEPEAMGGLNWVDFDNEFLLAA